jgi:hypothetical protein
MPDNIDERVRETVVAIYRSESRRILATLIRLLGDFDLAEDAPHDAFRAALERWPKEGVPANPRAWLGGHIFYGAANASASAKDAGGRFEDQLLDAASVEKVLCNVRAPNYLALCVRMPALAFWYHPAKNFIGPSENRLWNGVPLQTV